MKLAILFWCYKEPDVCFSRIRLLRHHNPSEPIYVLYGGSIDGWKQMHSVLSPFIDDFWYFDLDRPTAWKWIHGDQLLTRWYVMRGCRLRGWTHLFVVQWDMLVAAPIGRLLGKMPDNAAVFTGRLELKQVKNWWSWVRGPKNKLKLALFRLKLLIVDHYSGVVFTAPFIVVCVPWAFFDRLSRDPFNGLGFIEYGFPTLAEAWGFPHWSTTQLEAWRPGNPATREIPENRKIISAAKKPVDPTLICAELRKPTGFRVFHPVHATDTAIGLGDLPYKALF